MPPCALCCMSFSLCESGTSNCYIHCAANRLHLNHTSHHLSSLASKAGSAAPSTARPSGKTHDQTVELGQDAALEVGCNGRDVMMIPYGSLCESCSVWLCALPLNLHTHKNTHTRRCSASGAHAPKRLQVNRSLVSTCGII